MIFGRTPALALVFVYLVLNILSPFVYLFWFLVLQPIRLFSFDLYWKLEGKLFEFAVALGALHLILPGQIIYESGDDLSKIPDDDVVLAMPNHQNMIDVPLLLTAFQNRNVLHKITFIMEWWFKYIHFGFISYCHGTSFVRKVNRSQPSVIGPQYDPCVQIHKDVTQFVVEGKHKWIVLFPEGGFLYKRKESSQRYARKNGLPILNNVTLPHVGAAESIINALNRYDMDAKKDSIKLGWIVDVTIGYKAPVSPLKFIFAWDGVQETELHYRVFPASEVLSVSKNRQERERHLTQWMYKLYEEKEQLLGYFFQNGSFPTSAMKIKRRRRDLYNRRLLNPGIILFILTYVLIYQFAAFVSRYMFVL